MKNVKGTAIVITEGIYQENYAKTAHGLVRGSRRFEVKGIIDKALVGQDAGELLDGKHRNIPFFSSISDALKQIEKPDYCVVGVATHGGYLPEALRSLLLEALQNGISIVNGVHEFAADFPELAEAAKANNAEIIDVRRPKLTKDLKFWSGEILNLKTPRIAVLGIDCAVGKRTTAALLEGACNEVGIKTEMIYTGQTGWMQGYKHGFIFDSTLNDFISGEIECALLECEKESQPDLMLIEGQSSLQNPAGPCGAEFLLSGGAKGVILQHTPFREFVDGVEQYGYRMPSVENEIALAKIYGSKVIAIALNGENGSPEALIAKQKELEETFKIPVVRPLEEGMGRLVKVVKEFM